MKHSLRSRVIVIVIGLACFMGMYASAQAEYIAVGCFTGVFESDGVTPLKDGDILQCLYAGKDGKLTRPTQMELLAAMMCCLNLHLNQKNIQRL